MGNVGTWPNVNIAAVELSTAACHSSKYGYSSQLLSSTSDGRGLTTLVYVFAHMLPLNILHVIYSSIAHVASQILPGLAPPGLVRLLNSKKKKAVTVGLFLLLACLVLRRCATILKLCSIEASDINLLMPFLVFCGLWPLPSASSAPTERLSVFE